MAFLQSHSHNKDIFSSYCLLSFVYIRSEAFRVVIALSDQLILLHVRGIESSIFIDCFLFKAVQKYIKPLKDRQKSEAFIFFLRISPESNQCPSNDGFVAIAQF